MARASKSGGFTLLEMLAVLAIAALVLAIALPRIGMNASPAGTEAVAMRVVAALEGERYAARRRGVMLAAEFDLRQNRILLATTRTPMQLPDTVTLGIRSVPLCDPSGRQARFFPDGTACAPVVTIASPTALRIITINPLTGAVHLAPVSE